MNKRMMLLSALIGVLGYVGASANEEASYVILTNLAANDPYYRAVDVLAQFRGVERTVSFEADQVSSAREGLRRLQPRYVAFVLRPETIDENFAAQVFELSTQMNDDPRVDFAYGFLTGATAEEAVKLVENTARAGREDERLPRKFFAIAQTGKGIGLPSGPGSDILLRAMERYADCFRQDGWDTHVIEWAGETDPHWTEKKPQVLAQIQGSRLVFLGGHGEATWSVGIHAADLEGLDLYPAVVLDGGCNAGVTSRWFLGTPDKRVREMQIPPSRSMALRLIKAGAIAHFAGVGGQCWAHCVPAVYPLYGAGRSVGEAVQAAYNSFIRDGATVKVHWLKPGEPWPSVEEWCSSFVRIAPCVLYGDPAYVPFPDAPERHHGLPQDFNPWAVGGV